MIEVVAVADSAGRQARFAESLSAASPGAGFDLQLRTHRELVAEVSVDQSSEHPPIVDPDRPLLWLSPGDGSRATGPDDRFLGSEAYAAARSIAFLTWAPVLNRPSAHSICGTFPVGPALAVRRARHYDPGAVVRTERFTGRWSADDGAGPTRLEVHDYASGRSSFGRPPDSTGPFRRRPAVDEAELVKVAVIGDRTIAAADVAPAARAASRRIASRYGLDLARVWWLVADDGAGRTLARIDGWLLDAGFGAELEEVADAVVAWVAGRLGVPAGASR